MNKKMIFLPGLRKQFDFLMNNLNIENFTVLVMGSGSAEISKLLQVKSNQKVEVIVEDYESLLNTKLELENSDEILVRLMDFESTDFPDQSFDLIYAQGSLTDSRRKKTIKEIKRILKPNGYFCLGEVIKLESNTPNFVNDLFDESNLMPLTKDELINFYSERNFEFIESVDLSKTLKQYYEANAKYLEQNIKSFKPNEKSYYKKILNKISHESNAYLKLGADRFMGFETLFLRKK